VGEIWGDALRWLCGDQFDAQMNYPFSRAAFGFFGGVNLNQTDTVHTGLGYIEACDGPQFAQVLSDLQQKYDPQIVQAQLNVLSTHDTPRLVTIANDDLSTVRLMFLCQMTIAGAPSIYYGDEIALPGGRDPDSRRAFPWHDRGGWNTDLLEDVRRYVSLRHETVALRRGAFEILHAAEQVVVYRRHHENQQVVVAFNVDQRVHTVTIENGLNGALEDVLQPGGRPLEPGVEFKLQPRSGYVWRSG
jgi:neopullulanase